jgi:hypothetical protein
MDHPSYCSIICVHVGRAADSETRHLHIPSVPDVRVCGSLATDQSVSLYLCGPQVIDSHSGRNF